MGPTGHPLNSIPGRTDCFSSGGHHGFVAMVRAPLGSGSIRPGIGYFAVRGYCRVRFH